MKLKMILTLTIVCCVSAFLLAKVHKVTSDKIAKNKTSDPLVYLISASFPNMKEYKAMLQNPGFYRVDDGAGKVLGIVKFTEKLVDTVWNIIDTSGVMKGIVCRVFPTGYSGPVEMFVAIGTDTSVIGVIPSGDIQETPGLGTKIKDPQFKNQFIGKKPEEILLSSDGGKIDAITGATISSNAVVNGVKKATEKYGKYLVQ